MVSKLPAERECSPKTANRQLRAFPAHDFSQNLGISKQVKNLSVSISIQWRVD